MGSLETANENVCRYRKSKELFPIIVSQDCDDQGVVNVVKGFGTEIEYIKASLVLY